MAFRRSKPKKEDIVYQKLSEAILNELINTLEIASSSYRPIGFLSKPFDINSISKEQRERLINLVIDLTEYVLEGIDNNKELSKILKNLNSDSVYITIAKKVVGSLKNPADLVGHIILGSEYDIKRNLSRDVYDHLLKIAREYR